MKRVVILYGGKSGEHEVSLISAASIVRHLDRGRYEPILVGIAKDGSWILQDAGVLSEALAGEGPLPLRAGKAVLALASKGLAVLEEGGLLPLECDLVFPVLHGTFGEDGTVQGFLEVAGLPYVGAGVLGSALGMDKEKSKELWLRAGLPVVPYIAVRRSELGSAAAIEGLARRIEARFGWPCFVKPACSGSSVGSSKVDGPRGLGAALDEALAWDEKAMVEPFVSAREIECAVLGNASPRAFPPGEVIPSHEFYDYEAKYLDPQGARFEIPARLSAEQAERVTTVAVAAFKACECSGMARVDFFVDKRTGEVLLNELNTIPGFTHISMYPKMCESGGLAYAGLIERLLDLALERHAAREALRYSR
ncbi:MAG TPA: D-alanine--D-alanine ligase family protein [Rectinemataceae bacterium]|nr:D-alanine--D-alanine ligase family protein [Rectinemataceae bacterium]